MWPVFLRGSLQHGLTLQKEEEEAGPWCPVAAHRLQGPEQTSGPPGCFPSGPATCPHTPDPPAVTTTAGQRSRALALGAARSSGRSLVFGSASFF